MTKLIRKISCMAVLFAGCIIFWAGSMPLPKASAGAEKEGRGFKNMIKPVSYLNVKIADNFWKPKIDLNRIAGIRSVFRQCSYSLDNFDIASGKKKGEHKGTAASDSDVYKIIQGAAYALHHNQDRELESYIDSLIDRIVAAQQPDGYLFTYWTVIDPGERWKDGDHKHELYCAGHMFEAAVAYFEVTGKRKFLDSAIKLADHIGSIFGPDKRHEAPGHEEIELALVKLYEATGEKRFLSLSQYFIDERGNPERIAPRLVPPKVDPNANKPSRWRNPSYQQDHLPVTDQHVAVGHAVRAAYLYSGITDVAMATHSSKYLPALNDIWNDITRKKLYVTGAIGTSEFHDEGFGKDYLLPNDKAYCETCSAIALMFWNKRMNLLDADTKYADMLELTMYNSGISGVSLTGDRFFYTNPLESKGKNKRSLWFEPGCCPSNMVRFLPEIGSYLYGKNEDGIFVNQFIASEANIKFKEGEITLKQEGNYPWDGKIRITVNPGTVQDFKLNVRIPGWAKGQWASGGLYNFIDVGKDAKTLVVLSVNGQPLKKLNMSQGYAVIDRKWKKGDLVEMDLPMDVKVVSGNPKIEDIAGKIVLSRGPVVYCVEEVDNPRYFDENNEAVLFTEGITAEYQAGLLGGVVKLKGKAFLVTTNEELDVTAIPYYAWCNRQQGKMKVWMTAEKKQ
jgi:DUF1680 family protein